MGIWLDIATPLATQAAKIVFGESVTYTPAATGTPATVTAVFDQSPEVVTLQDGTQVQGTRPTLDVEIALLAGYPKRNDLVTARGVDYSVIAVAPDGDGWALLTLGAI